ncbi:hypothetical protein [Nocardia sp. NPDC052566]|uniref:hypothetical protein n=1 Tax=Nocardia sp. NPDC052566 TaxID=3364330 RepID=UPI0037CAFA72
MYVDLLTNTSLLDPSVWTSSDVLSAAVDYQAKKRKGGSGLFIIGGLCCLLVIVGIVGIIYLLTKRKNQQ